MTEEQSCDESKVVENAPTKKRRAIGTIGIVVGFIALACAFLSPWIQEMIDPPDKPVEESVAEFAGKLLDAAKSRLKGEEYLPAKSVDSKPSRFLVPSIIGMGLIGAGLGIIGLLRSESRAVGGGAVALGIGAAIVQLSIVIAGAVLFIILVLAIMSFLSAGSG